MTKREAFSQFRNFIEPGVIKYYGKTDRIALRTAWNDWTDSLCKSGDITQRQYDSWTNPYSNGA